MKYATIVLALAASLAIGGCGFFETKTTSPYSFKQVTADELVVERARVEQEAKEEAEKAFAEAKALAISARKKSAIDAAEAEAMMAEAEAKAETAGKTLKVRLEGIDAKHTAAIAAIDTKNERTAGVFTAAASAANSFGPMGIAAGSVISLIGGLWGNSQRKRAIDAEAKAKQAQAEHAEALTNASRVVDSIDALRLASPEVAAAFDRFKGLLSDWQGEKAKRFVDSLQAGILKT